MVYECVEHTTQEGQATRKNSKKTASSVFWACVQVKECHEKVAREGCWAA